MAVPAHTRVEVRAQSRRYDVCIGTGLLAHLGPLLAECAPVRRALLITDDGLPARWIEAARRSLPSGLKLTESRQPANESSKAIPSAQRHLERLALERLERGDAVIGIGGGITTDVAGFVAAIYRRGVPWIACPTTLLAMVDAAVGGKTGVNLELPGESGGLKKNMVGAFHQPLRVVADVETLTTLTERELRCGLAECVKHAMIAAEFGDPGLLDWTEANRAAFLARDPGTMTELVARNVAVKATVVGADEREELEEAGRALLNLGHTFAHVIETLPGVFPEGNPAAAPLRHGEAVALGLIAACRTAEALGLGAATFRARITGLLHTFGLPTRVAGLPDHARLAALMAHDKKVMGGRTRLILPTGPGTCRVVEDPPPAAVAEGWAAIRG